MNRSKKIIIVSHCILNSNSKVEGLSQYEGIFKEIVDILDKENLGIIQLPCPEILAFGMKRWGHTKDQFDTLDYRRKCNELLRNVLDEIYAYNKIGYKVVGVIGVDGSPTCGVDLTCRSEEWCGTLDQFNDLEEIKSSLEMTNEPGILIEEFIKALKNELDIKLPFIGINELDVFDSVNKIEDFVIKSS